MSHRLHFFPGVSGKMGCFSLINLTGGVHTPSLSIEPTVFYKCIEMENLDFNVLRPRIHTLPKYCNSIWSVLFPSNSPTMLFILSTISHQIPLEAIPTWNLIIHPICLSSFLLQSFHLSHSQSSLTVGMTVVKVSCGLEVEGVFIFFPLPLWPLTLHIYADGLDGSHPHPVLGFAVVATPLHPLNALNAQRLIVDRCFLELVWCTACRLRPPYLKREGEGTKCWIDKRCCEFQ